MVQSEQMERLIILVEPSQSKLVSLGFINVVQLIKLWERGVGM